MSRDWHYAGARVDYAQPWDTWVKRLKFAGDWPLAETMGAMMRESPWCEQLRKAADWVLPMPVSNERMIERGYNQAAWLARRWCGRDSRLQMGWLIKWRHTPAQAQSDRPTRLAQIQGTLGLSPLVKQGRVAGARILLVDDVMTTGATLSVATRALLAAGAKHVDVVVFARTPEIAPHP